MMRATTTTSKLLLLARGARVVPRAPLPSLKTTAAFSTDSKSDDDGPKKELTALQKLNKWLQPFARGSKELFLENKRAWQLRARLRESKGEVTLSRQEMMVLRQAHRDLLKSLPLLAFFAVPLVGYAAPLVGYQFPKQLLPWQFWRPEQRTAFFREDAHARAAFYPALVQLLEQIDRKDKVLQELLATKDGLNPAQVGELAPFFDGNGGPARLDALSAKHVHVLTRSLALFPAFSALTHLLPTSYLLDRLTKRADELYVDDQMLLKEGIDALSLSELEFACVDRGIVGGYGDIDALRGALRDWLAIYDTDHPEAPPLPPSLLLHAPALVRFSEPKTL